MIERFIQITVNPKPSCRKVVNINYKKQAQTDWRVFFVGKHLQKYGYEYGCICTYVCMYTQLKSDYR